MMLPCPTFLIYTFLFEGSLCNEAPGINPELYLVQDGAEGVYLAQLHDVQPDDVQHPSVGLGLNKSKWPVIAIF
jgi:hypothetical protein